MKHPSCLRHFVGWPEEKLGFHCSVLPREFPQQMVIIGDTVYSIMSYGLPLYKSNTTADDPKNETFHGDFHPIGGGTQTSVAVGISSRGRNAG
jgi:hypothetical protein